MSLKALANNDSQPVRNFSLRLVLVVPFVLQIFVVVGLTGYLSFRNGQKAINSLANQLQAEISGRIDQHLDNYLATPHQINQINANAVELGLLDLQDFKGAGHYFWKQMQVFNVGYIYYALSTGKYAAAGYNQYPSGSVIVEELSQNKGKTYTYATDSQGNRTKLIEVYDDYEPQKEAWYKDTVRVGKPVWSQVYQWASYANILSVSAGYPLYSDTHTLIAVLGVDLRLSQISDFLRQLKISPSGRTFIVERDGLMIASSGSEQPFTIIDKKAARLNALNSSDPLIQATAKYLQYKFGNFQEIKDSYKLDFIFKDNRQFVQVTPWRNKFGLDWLVVVAVPEADFMAQINANTRTTIWLCIGALGLATIVGILTSRWITQPILRLSQASRAIASGDLNQQVEVKNIQELGGLAASFNQMAAQLQESFTTLEKTKEEAEAARVAADIANQAKSGFIANMSHELRTPLNGILGYAQILLKDKTTNHKQIDGLNIIHQCGSHLLQLINDILDISKIEAQKLELYPTDLGFEKFLLEVFQICRTRAEQKEIEFSYQALNHLPPIIHADEKRLRQVLINLISNAIKFTDKGSVIFQVGVLNTPSGKSAQAATQKICFQVEDTGIGITSEQLEKIFLPFEQVGEGLSKIEGTGLGLAISTTIVKLMGSEIKVESKYGIGSKFWFELDLPTATKWLSSEPFNLNQNVIGYQGKQQTILIVDDRWENRSVIVNLLEPIGFKVIEAENGQKGFDKAREFQPDLIIADLAMPIMDGIEMTQRLRELEEFKHKVILASSALAFSFDRQHRELGYSGFLSKPVHALELFEQLQHYLGLAWIRETENKLISEMPLASTQVEKMIVPPREELQALYQAAKAGCVSQIQEEVNRINQLDPIYAGFADQVFKLAEEFDDEAIVNLVKPYLS